MSNKRILSSSEHTTILDMLSSLHSIVSSAEFSKDGETALPAFDSCTTTDYAYVLSRTLSAVEAYDDACKRARMGDAKIKIDRLMHIQRLARLNAYKEVMSLSHATRALLPVGATECPKETYILVSDVQDCFPGELTAESVIPLLLKMNYKVGSAKRAEDRKIFIAINMSDKEEEAQAAE